MKNKKKKSKLAKFFTVFGITLGSLIGVVALTVGSYVIYVSAQYYRIPDNQILDISNNQNEVVPIDKELKLSTLNVGFGAYNSDFTFFLDEGIEADGTKKVGYSARAFSKEQAIINTKGCIDALKNLQSDFYVMQEVDEDSDRCHHIDQTKMIAESFKDYCSNYAINFHTAYLIYPIYQWHGASTSGLQTLSKYKISNSVRKSYTVTKAFPTKFFDLDRCFVVNYLPLSNGKQLVLINNHMSAYDEGGKIRNKQIDELSSFMQEEYEKGNYVVAGGDFNHDLLTYNPDYNYDLENRPYDEIMTQILPPWVSFMFNEDGHTKFGENFKIIADDQVPTCRGDDIPYEYGHTYVATVDGFIVSKNVSVLGCETVKMPDEKTPMFAYTDHQPSTLTFKLS